MSWSVAGDDAPLEFNNKVRSVLLESLRFSENPGDRDLLALAAAIAPPRPRMGIEAMMRDNPPIPMTYNMNSFWRQPPPKHDFTGAIGRLIERARDAATLSLVLKYAPRDAEMTEKLKVLRAKTTNEAITKVIDGFLAEKK